jgi:hypothetical protein
MHLNVYDVFYSLYSSQHVSSATAAIIRVMLLLQEHKGTSVVSCVADTPAFFEPLQIWLQLYVKYLPTYPPTHQPTNQPTYLPTTYLPTYLPNFVVLSIKKLMVAHRMQKFAKFHMKSHNWTQFYAIIQSTPLRLIYFKLILVWSSPLQRPVHIGTGSHPPQLSITRVPAPASLGVRRPSWTLTSTNSQY